MATVVTPSLPAASYEDITTLLTALKGEVDGVQIDIVDGQFVPPISWPFTVVDPVTELERLTEWSTHFAIGVDCMVKNPDQYLDTIIALGAQRVIFHLGSTDDYQSLITKSQAAGLKVALALTSTVPLSELELYVEQIDFVQLMGIKEVGQQGQPFDEATLERAITLRQRYPELDIGVDGAVNETTIPALKEAGVNRFAPGSAIAKAADPVAAYKQLTALAAA